MRLSTSEFAEWWPLVDDPADYAEEAGVYADRLQEACDGPIESLLELGCGGGNTALHLKRRFPRLLLTDLSPEMLAVSRALNPECEHRIGDMRTLRLDRDLRRRLRPRRRLLHDHRSRPAPRDGDGVGALPPRRRGAVPARLRARELPGRGIPGRLRRAAALRFRWGGGARAALPGVGLGPRSRRYGVLRRLRVTAARARRFGPMRARAARRGPVRARSLAGSPDRGRVRAPLRAPRALWTWSRAATRCSWGAGRADRGTPGQV